MGFIPVGVKAVNYTNWVDGFLIVS